ncbi:MAG TPA: rhodanese-like domain-containing protein [Marmoricola sp.]|nr:rhodanese-like domain-containing protein [Marmoricola sp.]HMY08879.1 rhodanese-like domain-containing protein [Marmoricola sp.]
MSDTQQTGVHIAFYRFVAIEEVERFCDRINEIAADLLGTVLVAPEGVNGMLAGPASKVEEFLTRASSDPLTKAAFDAITTKTTTYQRPPFSRLKIKAKTEIVPLGISGLDMPARVADVARTDVPPREWRELIKRDDVVLIDNRNSFEYDVGHFEGAIDPGITNFRDFADYVQANAQHWRDAGTKVAMYCTGGIRCEKSSPWMQDLGLEVFQLQGGILNYFAQLPDAEADFVGECFVFDNRITLDTTLADVGRERTEIDG